MRVSFSLVTKIDVYKDGYKLFPGTMGLPLVEDQWDNLSINVLRSE